VAFLTEGVLFIPLVPLPELTFTLYRGYLLYGAPGSGKSSLIHSLAGELTLDIYVISLSASWMNDSTLTNLMSRIPARSILLLEDLDAAFTHSTSRDSDSTGAPEGKKEGPKNKDEDEKKDLKKDANDQNTLSLSGLLNSLDSIQASEGRILFATTNHLERLDPALSRPGRMDVWVEFKNASKYQAEGLFRNFFPAHEDDIEITTESTPVDSDGSPSLSRTDSFASTSATASSAAFTPSSKSALISHEVAPTLEHASPLDAERLTPARLSQLAKFFADAIPDEEFSVAALQGYLLKNKTRPEAAASDAGKWVIAERELREKLARQKEERERKAREERERRRKEREEKERKEKEEKERKEKEEKEKADAEAKKAEEKAKEETAKSDAGKDAAPAEKPKEPAVEKAESVAPSEDFEKVD
jgi:chaperone BCS1